MLLFLLQLSVLVYVQTQDMKKCFLLCYLSQFGVVKNILFTFRRGIYVIFVGVICRNDWWEN